MLPLLLNPWMLLGMGLMAIPIAIHLFNKSRFKIEPWGAMMFLQEAMQVRARRMKLEQILLLLLRCLLFVLLAVALARPVVEWGEGSLDDPTTHVLVIDGSFSMQQGEGEDNAFFKAREQALAIVEGMREQDNMSIILAGNKPQLLFPKASFDKSFLRDKLEALEVGVDEIMDLPKAFAKVYFALEQSTLPRHRVTILTDAQEHGWRWDEKARWAKVAEHAEMLKVEPTTYVFEQQPSEKVLNTAILRVFAGSPVVDSYRPTRFFVEVANYRAKPESLHLDFYVDGTLQDEQDVDLPPGVSTIEFTHSFTRDPDQDDDELSKVTPHVVTVSLEEDDLPIDDTYSLALAVRHTIPVLVIDGNDADELWESGGGLLSLALGAAAEPGAEGLFDVTRQGAMVIEDMDVKQLQRYRAVVLANVPSFPRNFQFALEQFVERGGGLLVTLGDRVDPSGYSAMSGGGKGLIPAELDEVRTYDERPFRPSFPAGEAGHILDIFDIERTRVLQDVRVEKYWRCRPADDAVRLASFDDDPFLLYRSYGEGRVMVWTTSADAKWTNFPITQDFLPLLHNLVIYLAASVEPPINLGQGETLVYALPQAPTGEDGKTEDHCTLLTPDGESHSVAGEFIGDEWVAEWPGTIDPGVYTVAAAGEPPRYYAVAFRSSESDLEPLPPRTRDDLLDGPLSHIVATEAEYLQAVNSETGAQEWWRILVFLTLVLLCLELLCAWRYSQ